VNILPGRDGLLHISRLGQGKRIDRVEDVLELGQSVDVTVDDIDPQGKISLSLVGADGQPLPRATNGDASSERRPARESSPAPAASGPSEAVRKVSFEDEFAAEIERDFGNLGPADIKAPSSGDDRGPRRRSGPRR